MHNHYYFIRQVSKELEKVLIGTVISECFSQAKDELVIRFETHSKPFFIKAALASGFSSLSFPAAFERARKNSVDLFPGMIGYRVTGLRQFQNERSFVVDLEEGKTILFKLHGNRSNVLLLEKNTVLGLFRNNFPGDEQTNLEQLDRHIDWSYQAFLNNQAKPEALYFTFGKVVWTYLSEKGFNTRNAEEKWKMIENVLHVMETPSYYLTELKGKLHLTLLQFGNSRKIIGSALEASNSFYYSFTQEFVLEKEKAEAISRLRSRLSSSQNYYDKNFEKLSEIETDTNYKTWADIIMANLHNIKPGMEKVVLNNFYKHDEPVEIKLKKDLSPQANAAAYYRKAKNQHIEIDRITKALAGKERDIEEIKKNILLIQSIEDLKALRKTLLTIGLNNDDEKQHESRPYHEFIENGFRIWVGKNAQGNDELTLKFGYKEDLWLHAKDVSGSHVLIKHQAGKNFPKNVIERAAQLAAYNSKRKTDTLCPVIVTPRKFVRKRKGDPAGAVVVEREEVILVEPKL